MSELLFKEKARTWDAHKYQLRALRFLLEHSCAGLLLSPGLGKTSITLAAIKYLKDKGIVHKVLIIAPLRVCHAVWPAEIARWKDFSGLSIGVLHGKRKEAVLKEDHDVYVINPEGTDWLFGVQKTKSPLTGKSTPTVNVRKFKRLGFDTLVIDELSRYKHYNTSRFKAIKQVLKTFSRRWGLTGSPTANGLLDLFGQCYMLDMGNALGQYITHYRSKYFASDFQGYNWTVVPGKEKEIYAAIEPLMLRMSAEDYLTMPQVIEDNIIVELPVKAYKVYDELEKDLIAQIEESTVVAANAAVASSKCRQVACGGVYTEPDVLELGKGKEIKKREWKDLHTEKINALLDLIDELQGAPLLVAYDFEHDLARLRKALGKNVPYIGGGCTTKQTAKVIEAWNAGKIPVLLAHPMAAGHGLNLQEGGCQHVCWHSLTWNFELYDQFNRRVLRQGNKHDHVFVYHIMARGTIDEVILKALKSKKRGQDALFSALKELKKRRLG